MKNVSIAIPTKNAGSGFQDTLEAIHAQKYSGKFEVIIVDSGSTDNTLEIAQNYPVKIKRILSDDDITAYPFAKDWGNYKYHDTASKYLSSCLTPVKLALRIPKITWKVCSVINNINPDIIFYNLVPLDPLVLLPFIYRYRKKIQVARMPVWFPLELSTFSKNKVNIAFGTYLYKKLVKQFNTVITQSTAMQNVIMNQMGNTSPCMVIPDGVDISRFSKANSKQHKFVRILFVGRLSTEKGIEDLICSLSLLSQRIISQIELLIVGGGTTQYISFLKRLVSQNGLEHKVKFLGEVNWAMTPNIYKSADLFVLPSYNLEGLPQTLLEAMASSLPIIATNVGGVQNVIKDEVNGLLFESGDIKKIARCIEALVEDEGKRSRLSDEAYKTALNFNWQVIAKKYLELFEHLLAGSK